MGWRDLFGLNPSNPDDNDDIEYNNHLASQAFGTSSTVYTTCKNDPEDENTLICVEETSTVDKDNIVTQSQKEYKVPKSDSLFDFPPTIFGNSFGGINTNTNSNQFPVNI